MLIDGQFDVAAAPADVLAHLFDARLMASCLPGCESLEQSGDDRYRAVVAVALAGVKARFDLQVEVTERLADGVRATTRGEEGGNASTLQATSEVRLSPVAGRHARRLSLRRRRHRPARPLRPRHDEEEGAKPRRRVRREPAAGARRPAAPVETRRSAGTARDAARRPVVATIPAPPRSWWARLLQWLRARLGHASPHHP